MEKTVVTYRVDDLLVLYTVIKSLGIGRSVDKYIKVHGNWTGTLPGSILELWLCYILSECDHRLSGMEEWAKQNIVLLRLISGKKNLSGQDFSDDKLGKLLECFSNTSSWTNIEIAVNNNTLSIYKLEEGVGLPTFRLDAAPMQSHGKIKPDGLLQYGYHKHHAKLPQFKLKLCTLDNEVNHFAYPVCHLTINGKESDDGLYIPIIKESKKVLSGVPGLQLGNLYVGDSKFGSLQNRLFVFQQLDYYLMPLSLVQLPAAQRKALIDSQEAQSYEQVYKKHKQEDVLMAEGFEVQQAIEIDNEQGIYGWDERRIFVHSISYSNSQQRGLENRLNKATASILYLQQSKQGKSILNTKREYEQAIDTIVKEHKVEGLLEVAIKKHQKKIKKRKYGDRPERIEIVPEFNLSVTRQEAAIQGRKKYMGWQVYATNAPKSLLPFKKCVWKYRYQSNIESRFDDIRNKMAALLPVYLQKDNRIKGLVNILLLALKVCSMMEYKVAKELQTQNELLRNVYEGNSKRGTDRPSIKRILKPFEGISISVILEKDNFQFAFVTPLKPVQQKILQLLDLNTSIYDDLITNVELFFSKKIIIET